MQKSNIISLLHDRNLQKLDNTYRENAGIISVSEIQKIIEQYNTKKRPFFLLLGWDETTLTGYGLVYW